MAERKENPIVRYFKGVRSEFQKITWPTPKQVTNNTVTVIIAVIVIGLFIFVLDTAFGWALQYFIK